MTDDSIYHEDDNMRSTKAMAHRLQEMYQEDLREPSDTMTSDERTRRSRLIMRWPDNDLVRQLILDTARLMKTYHVNPNQVTW